MSETRAAIYARRSVEQQVSAEAKSVTRQIENGRAFAVAQGWTVEDEHVFVDDGFSGAEFAKRPGLQRLLAAVGTRAPFQVLIVSEQKSIGREMFETGNTIKRLAEAGVEVREYMHGRSLTPKNATEKVLSSVHGYADEMHREQTADRMREAHTRLARKGYVTGGRLFGYRNVDKFSGTDEHGRPLRSHVEREVEPAEAAVVLRIFEMFDSGLGLKAIAKRLTAEGAPAPKYSRHRTEPRVDPLAGVPPIGGWAPTTVGSVLAREVYHGVTVWNKAKKRDDWGQARAKARPEAEWISTPAEHLRIVPEELWRRVAARRADTEGRVVRFDSGRLSGRPTKHDAANLLAGLSTCGLCGGGLIVATSKGPMGDAFTLDTLPRPGSELRSVPRSAGYRYYVCGRRRANGACSNVLRVRADLLEEEVLCAVEQHALTPEAIEQVILLSERDELQEDRKRVEHQMRENEHRIRRLLAAIEGGGDAASLVTRVKQLEDEQRGLQKQAASLRPVPRLHPAVVGKRLEEWRRLLRRSTTQGRAVLQRVLRGRLTFWPLADGTGYEFAGPTRFDRLFTGIAAEQPAWVPSVATGTENIRAEDTMDPDYSELLEGAARAAARLGGDAKGLATLEGFEPSIFTLKG
jgi:site-specific DNA recombinase